jgi:triosephosphate isomerase (TIM)
MSTEAQQSPILLGVSLKMYFGRQQTLDWCAKLAELSRTHPAFASKLVECFVLPSVPFITDAAEVLSGLPVDLGAQDLAEQDSGAFTGGVSGASLFEIGCKYVEIGHAERKTHFGESESSVALKMAAANRNNLAAVLCVGEELEADSDEAAKLCVAQIENAISLIQGPIQDLVVAYEPVWAIGAEVPAGADHIKMICTEISKFLASSDRFVNPRVIYGGSAGPGLLTKIDGSVSGLFLGRFAHEIANLEKILDEVLELAGKQPIKAAK